MIGYIQSMDLFELCLKIGPNENQLQFTTIKEVDGLPFTGHFAEFGGERILFYRWDGDLKLRIGDSSSILASGILVDWICSGDNVQVVLRRESEIIFCAEYPLNCRIKHIDNDPTSFIEVEHFDFFLFVRNVLSDGERMKRIYTVQQY